MGKAIEQIAKEADHEVVCIIEETTQLDNLVKAVPQVAIEFTRPESAAQNIEFCLNHGIPVISGTTGWLDKYNALASLCHEKNGTFLHSSNFSIGVNLFFELNEWLAQRIEGLGFNSSIEETHHTEKLDSPSGTAIRLAEGIQRNNKSISGWTNEESADHTKLPIISKRIPNVPGTHVVSYQSKAETIRIEHIAHERGVFAKGAVAVAEWIMDKKGVFSMSDFINAASTAS